MLQCSQPDVAVLSDGCCRAVRWMLQGSQVDVAVLSDVVQCSQMAVVQCSQMETDVAMSSD